MKRKKIMVELADAFVILPGGVGTFEEFFETFTLKQLGQLNKPIAVLNVEGYFDVLKAIMDQSMDKGFMKRECGNHYGIYSYPDELLDYIENVHEEPMDIYKLKLG